ncbi:hypothetical protein HI914_06792 [Erysiphe necator]|uniref:Uncharacterized protein n=1 Tax=Uncinula necator TaxID=52586 RepID=A0A0B1P654_UNCNE|nr:hypothetical protein HI914_06792 [Erysiphe necator]KHJ32416.1 hypothetical protein EV44_g6045 [Erysiphe necator]
MAPKPFKPPRPSIAISSSLSSSLNTMKKTAPDQSMDGKHMSEQKKKKMNSSRISSGSGSNTTSLTPGNKKVGNVSAINKRRKIIDKSDRRASSMSTIKLPSLSPSTSDEVESGGKRRSLIDSEAEEGESSDQEDEFMKDLEIDEIMDNDDDDNSENGDDPFGSATEIPKRSRNYSSFRLGDTDGEDEDEILADIDNDVNDDEITSTSIKAQGQSVFIPRDLLSVLLHEMFKSTDDTQEQDREGNGRKIKIAKKGQIRMTKQAVDAVGKYLDTFVKEAIARAACESLERGGIGVLEVEDLERLAPQLILDF